jgi:predicted CXXCH cytochrome family protein
MFAAFSIECPACRGDVDLNHTNDTSLVLLSKKRREDARAVTAICSRCHLPGGRHVARIVRDVDTRGETGVTCLSCHQVHTGSSQKHQRVLRGPLCEECHEGQGPMKAVKPYQVRNPMCEY